MKKSEVRSSKVLRTYNSFSGTFIWKEKNISQLFLEILSNFQLISIILSEQFFWVNIESEGPVSRFFKFLYQLLSFKGYFTSETGSVIYDAAAIAICTYFLILAVFILWLTLVSSWQKKICSLGRETLIHLAELHHGVIFWIINIMLFAMVNHKDENVDSDAIFQGTGRSIMIGVFMPLNYIVGFWAASNCSNPFLRASNKWAKSSALHQQSTFWYKAILGFISGLIEDKDYKWAFIFVSLAVVWVRYELLLRNIYYFNFSTFQLVSMLSSFGVSFSLGAIIVAIVNDYHEVSWSYLFLLEIGIAILVLALTNSRIYRIIGGCISKPRETKFRRPHEVMRKLMALSYIYENSSPETFLLKNFNSSMVYLFGYVGRHREDCEYKDCFCKKLKGEEENEDKGVLSDNGLGDTGLIYAQCEVLQRAIRNLKDNIGYKILLISLQYKRKELFAKALVNVYSMHNAKMTQREVLLVSVMIEKLENEVRKFFVRSKDGVTEENVMNVKDMVDFTTESNSLTKLLEENSEEYIKIWNYYSQPEMVLSELLKQMSAQEKKAEEVERHWNSLSMNYPGYSLQLYPVYYTYLSLIRNIPVLAEKRILNIYYHKLKVKESNFANKIVDHIENNSKHNVVFYISIAKESFGKVIYVSNRIHKFLGWSQAESVGKNISVFQPPFIGKVYSQILQEYVEKETSIIKACQSGFARTREGFLSPIYLYTTLYPYIDVQPMYIVINSPRVLRSEVLVLTEEGIIDCFTQGIAKRLNLDPNKFFHIDEICGEWKKLGVTGVRRHSQKTSSDWNKTRTEFTTESRYLRERDLDFSNEEESNPIDDKEISITFWPCLKSEGEVKYSVKTKRFGAQNSMLCLYLDEQGVTREAHNSKVSKLLEEAEDSLFNEEIPIETYGVIDQKGMSTENKLTIDGEFGMMSPAQSSTSPLRTHMTRAENKKLLPKGILHSPRLTTRGTTNMFLQNMQTFQSSHESHRNFRRGGGDKRQSEKSIINKNVAPSSERASIAGSSRTDTNEKLEKATYCLPKDKLMNLLSYLISTFVIICCLLVCIYVVYESVKLNSIQKTNTMIASMQEQMTTMLNAITPVQLILLVNLGLITESRFSSAGVASLRLYMVTKIDYYLENYITVSREVIDNMDYLSHDLLSELYDDRFLVNYYNAEDSDADRKVNNFELYSELTSTFTNLVQTPVANFLINNTNLLFIFNNTLNSPLVASNREVQTILQDSKDNLNYVLSINLMLALLAASIGICLLILLSVDFKKYIRKRNYLIEILLRLDQKKLSNHLALVKGFSERLKAKEYELENEKQLRMASTGFTYKEREVKGYAKQNKKNNKKLNLQTITGLILTMISIVILVSIFIIFNFLYRVHLNKILTKLDNMVELNQMGIDLSLANVGILDYIINANSTYLENKPIEEVLNRILDDSATIPQFFSTISGDDEYQNDIVQTIIEKSLCDVSDIVSYPTATCKALASGLLDRGLIQVLNYLVQGYSSTKATYDLYGHTTLAAKLALNTKEKVVGEQIATFIVIAYLKIEHILRIQLDNLIDNHKTIVIDVVIIYAFIYVIIGASLYSKVWRNIKYERLSWRRTLRLVPFPIIQSNKLLKLYLINNSDHMLDSIKSALL